MPPRVHYYAHCWNEAELVPHMLRHYRPWCERMVVYDDGSDDGTVELLRAAGVEVRPLGHCANFCEHIAAVKGAAWKESRGYADWVMLVDLDEFLDRPEGMPAYLRALPADVTAVRSVGYHMASETFPADLARVARGLRDEQYDKWNLFRPDAFVSVGYTVGFHFASFTPDPRSPEDSLRPVLLHHRYLGRERTWQRYQSLRGKLRAGDNAKNYGFQYGWSREQFDQAFDAALAGAGPLGDRTT